MNNDQFRKLILANSAKASGGQRNGTSSSPTGGASAAASSSALGSRQKSSIPMTPYVDYLSFRLFHRRIILTAAPQQSIRRRLCPQ